MIRVVLFGDLKRENGVRGDFAARHGLLREDRAARGAGRWKAGNLRVLKTRLLKLRLNDRDRFTLKTRAEIRGRRLAERNQKVNRGSLQIGCGRRRILRNNLVGPPLRPIERGHVANGQPALDGRNPRRAQASSDKIRNGYLWRAQADQHVDILERLDAGSAGRHLGNDAALRNLGAEKLVFNFQVRAKAAHNLLRLRDGQSHKVGQSFLAAMDRQTDRHDGGHHRNRDQYGKKKK